jgi:hypothetical protein
LDADEENRRREIVREWEHLQRGIRIIGFVICEWDFLAPKTDSIEVRRWFTQYPTCSHMREQLMPLARVVYVMSRESLDDTVKFRAGPLKEAATELDSVHLGGINISELAREGLTQMLRRTMTDDDKIAIYERYSAGDLSEDAARVLLGEEFDLLQEDIDAFREATEDDTSDYLA